MATKLENKTALITGSTSGLGYLLATELAKQKVNLILHGRNEDLLKKNIEELKSLNTSGNFSYIVCDLNKPETVSNYFSQINSLDILINNAGVWAEGDTLDISPDRILELVNVNLSSYLTITRTLLPILLKAEFGQILNVSSVAGYEIPSDYFHTIYSATKFGLQGFSEGLTKEFSGKNLRVMGFYPGGMSTQFFKKAGIDYQDTEPWMFNPQESVEAILFMLTRNKKVNIKRMDLITHLFE